MSLDTMTHTTANSNIYICKGVPFGRDYTSTILFTSYTSQREFFNSKAKYVNSAMKPFTLGDPIRVPYPAEQMYECNYLYFTSQTSAKHWCAFITNIKRVNQSTSDIYYDIDVLQSWMLEWNLGRCMVLREHVTNDSVGANLMPEPIDTGDLVIGKHVQTNLFDTMGVVVVEISKSALNNKCEGGIYQSNKQQFFEVESGAVGAIVDVLQRAYDNPDQIIAIYMFPKAFKDNSLDGQIVPKTVSITGVKYSSLDGYIPRNKKLYTYPYNMIYATTNDGDSCVWRYEWFGDLNNMNVQCACAYAPNAQAICAPTNYSGISTVLWDEKIVMQPFPMCSWITDTYRAYLAQNGTSIQSALAGGILQTIGGVAGTVLGSATAPVTGTLAGIGATMSGVASVGNTLQDIKNHAVQPVQARGSVAGDTMFSLGAQAKDFHFYQKCIQHEYAKAIDTFFDMYGYAVNTVKVPNITSRPSWNYIKTEGINITGEIALADIEKLNAIFDRGVTFWHGDYVGHYERSNV